MSYAVTETWRRHLPEQPDFFRDIGIFPKGAAAPPQIVRAYFTRGHVIGQYFGTCLMASLGMGMTAVFALTLPSPANLLAAALSLAGFPFILYLANRNDYIWVELNGATLRAKHLYTRHVVERPIEEIEDLLALVTLVRTVEVLIVEAWLGRIRGILIRFSDKRTPLQICRADPAMTNARELIEAIIYRMAERGEVDAEIVNLEGTPLIRRIFWKKSAGLISPQ